MIDEGVADDQQPDDLRTGGRDPRLAAGDDLVPDPGSDLVIGVSQRECVGRVERREEYLGDLGRVLRARSTQDLRLVRGRPVRPGRHSPAAGPRPPRRCSQIAPLRRASWAGQRPGSRTGPKISPIAGALAVPWVIASNSSADERIDGLRVTRSTCGSTWVGAGIASASSVEVRAGLPGKTERTWLSGPIPMRTRSNTGRPAPSRRTERRISSAYAGRAPGRAARLADRDATRERMDLLDRQHDALVASVLHVDARRAGARLPGERGAGEERLVDEEHVGERMVAGT